MKYQLVSLTIVALVAASVSLVFLKFANQESVAPQTQVTPTQVVENEEPAYIANPWKISDTTSVIPFIALSPSGQYVAGLCPATGVPLPTPMSNGYRARGKNELVIWRVKDRTEVARAPVSSDFNIVWSWAGDGIAVGNDIWYWKSEKLTPTSGVVGASPDAAVRWLRLEGNLYLEQSASDSTSMRAIQLSTAKEIKLAPHIVRRLQDLPPDSDKASIFNPEQLTLRPARFLGSVCVAIVREDVAAESSVTHSIHKCEVSVWDLVSGRRLWQWQGRYLYSVPSLAWSPNGQKIAVIGTLSPSADVLHASPHAKVEGLSEGRLGDQGIQILDGATGRVLNTFNALRFGGKPDATNSRWSTGILANTFVLDDWTWISHPGGPSEKQRLLRLFDGSQVKEWDVTAQWTTNDYSNRGMWDVSDDGHTWALATADKGLWIFKLPN